jgi:hypothetical protein
MYSEITDSDVKEIMDLLGSKGLSIEIETSNSDLFGSSSSLGIYRDKQLIWSGWDLPDTKDWR